MSDKDLSEFKADHSGGGDVKGAEAVTPAVAAGGEIKKRLADKKKKIDPKADDIDGDTPGQVKEELEEVDITEAFASIFEGVDISEAVLEKFETIFESAVNEAASDKASSIIESIEAEFEEKLAESVSDAMEEMTENLDKYLDHVVSSWMSENKLAVESGIKVEMAESFMESMKSVFNEHNISIDESEIDLVAELEEELNSSKAEANKAINEAIRLGEQIDRLQSENAFSKISEGLTDTQKARLQSLSENLDISDLDAYTSNLTDLKEAFFRNKPMINESNSVERETADEFITEDTTSTARSEHNSINMLLRALDAKK